MSNVETSAAVAELADRLRSRDERNHAMDARLRLALNRLHPLITDLPAAEIHLLAPQAVDDWRVIQQEDPDIFLIYIGTIRRRLGGNIARLISDRVGPPVKRLSREITLHTVAEIIAQPPAVDAIDGVLPSIGAAGIIGPPGCGKSFLADHFILSMAAGREALPGRKTQQAPGVIISAEGTRSLRLDAYTRHHRLNPDDLAVRVIAQAIDLRNGSDMDPLLEQLTKFKAAAGGLGIVTIDTLSRTFAGGNENSPDDMGCYVANIDRLWQELRCLVLVVHHTGKDESRGGRGHNSLLGALDSEIQVSKANNVRVLTVTKLRDGVEGLQYQVLLDVVDLGPHPDPRAAEGKRLTSCIVVPSNARVAERRRERDLPGVAKAALRALQEAVSEHGKVMPETSTIPRGVRAVRIADWRTQFRIRYGSDGEGDTRDADAIKKAFKRARETLLQHSAISISDPYVWTTQ